MYICKALYRAQQTCEILENTLLNAHFQVAATACWLPLKLKLMRMIANL